MKSKDPAAGHLKMRLANKRHTKALKCQATPRA